MNRNSCFRAEFLFWALLQRWHWRAAQICYSQCFAAKWWGAFCRRVVHLAGIWLLLAGWVCGSSLRGSTYLEVILNGSFPLSPEATLVIFHLELELLLIPEVVNSLELSASFGMEDNSRDHFRTGRCFCCRFAAVDTSSSASSSGQCTSTMFSFSTTSKTASGGPLSQSTPLAASPTTPLKASTPVPAAGRSLMHVIWNNAL